MLKDAGVQPVADEKSISFTSNTPQGVRVVGIDRQNAIYIQVSDEALQQLQKNITLLDKPSDSLKLKRSTSKLVMKI